MGDRATLAMAKKELEDLYLGVPDDSVNLTFQDFAQVRQHNNNNNININNEKKKLSPASPSQKSSEKSRRSSSSSPLTKLPSLDLSNHRHHLDQRTTMAYDDISHVSARRRPGIPHSNICALCCNYIYICRHRCLVCGRVYCRQCVSIGMGEMTEGRKCIECLGRRFSQRYIERAGNVGCCSVGYPSAVKQQELKWAERGPRRNGDNRYGNSVMQVSRSRSPVVGLATPSHPHHMHAPTTTPPPSFLITSPYSPTNHHPMPF